MREEGIFYSLPYHSLIVSWKTSAQSSFISMRLVSLQFKNEHQENF